MSIWDVCQGNEFIKELSADAWRVVEDQVTLSSRDLVDSREEHDLLEELIEESKPAITSEKNYLLFTPFRYPPLKYGSRFGQIVEPSLWYGSLDRNTAFTEVAFYRLKFFSDTLADLGAVEISMTAFTVSMLCKQGVDLTKAPFDKYQHTISDKESYQHSHLLGSRMREEGVDGFTYFSARTKEPKKNIAAFVPSVFVLKKQNYICNQQNWKCFTTKNLIEFTRTELLKKQCLSFSRNDFL